MIEKALQDKEIRAIPTLVEALKSPEREANPIIVDVLLNRFDGRVLAGAQCEA
jgi:hypothetical protein